MFELDSFVNLSAQIMEVSGILAMLGGGVVALYLSVGLRKEGGAAVFRAFRQGLGRAILLGLELLVAADIIRTISTMPDMEEVGVLAVIVLIRTFLSFTLQVELEGRLPWKSREMARAGSPLSGQEN